MPPVRIPPASKQSRTLIALAIDPLEAGLVGIGRE